MKIGDFFVRLGVKADTFTVKDFAHSIGEIPLSAAGAIASLAGLSLGFVDMTKTVLEMSIGLNEFTALTGDDTKSLQQWQAVAQRSGLSADNVAASFKNLSSVMGGLSTGHPNRAAMAALGQMGVGITDLKEPIGSLMNRIQASTAGMDPRRLASLLSQAGISTDASVWFMTSQKNRESINPILNRGSQNEMMEFTKALADMKHGVLVEFVKALNDIRPYLKPLTDALIEFVKASAFMVERLGKDITMHQAIEKMGGYGAFVGGLLDNLGTVGTGAFGPPHQPAHITNHLTVNGMADPHKAGDVIVETLDRQLRDTLLGINNGPRRG